MLRVLPDPGPLSPNELLALTPKEAALLEAFRRLFEVMPSADHTLAPTSYPAYVNAKGLYLRLRNRDAERDFSPSLNGQGGGNG